ncbi:MAG: NUDIX hydrolase [Flavobacteriales bacterium]|nr:NUDIX hydrolase [Flavobacteriales bacterium]
MKSKAKLVVYKDDSFLLLRKRTTGLRYVLLGGTLKKREHPKKACLREAKEEGNVDCQLKNIRFLTSSIEKNDDQFMYVYYFLTHDVDQFENMEPHKFIDLKWVPSEYALQHMRKSDRHILERFLEGHFVR